MLKKLTLLSIFLVLANVAASGDDHSGHDHDGEDHAHLYCAKLCEHDDHAGHDHMRWLEGDEHDEDVCGDGHGQKDECTDVTFGAVETFGYVNVTESFLGCSLKACEKLCGEVSNSTKYTIVGETICFPETTEMDGMYDTKLEAEVAAISRGCEGAHGMSGMFMIGETHPTCDGTYDSIGVEYGHDDHNHSGSAPVSGSFLGSMLAGGVGSLFVFGLF